MSTYVQRKTNHCWSLVPTHAMPKVHILRFMRPCISCDSCILWDFYCQLHTTKNCWLLSAMYYRIGKKYRKFIPSISCDLELLAILAFYAVIIASYTQCVLCDWYTHVMQGRMKRIVWTFGLNLLDVTSTNNSTDSIILVYT